MEQREEKQAKSEKLRMPRLWSKEGEDPFDCVTWTTSKVHLTDYRNGRIIYSCDAVEHPEVWSQNAVDTMASKYFRRADIPNIGGETSVRQLIQRVANCLTIHGLDRGYFTEESSVVFRDEIIIGFLQQRLGFNSPVWFNFGLFSEYGIKGSANRKRWRAEPESGEVEGIEGELVHPGGAACFLSAVDDTLFNDEGWGMFDHISNECRIFLTGAGDGFNASNIRGEGEPIEGGGISAGVISYLKPRDAAAGYIKSGGRTRRSATLICMDLDHPDIEEFIEWKGKEEAKAHALIEKGWPSDFEGEAYQTISGQNSNNSVRPTDEFMQAVELNEDWHLISRMPYERFHDAKPVVHVGDSIQGEIYGIKDPDDGTVELCAIKSNFANDGIIRKIMKTVKAADLFHQICQTAWECGCPGIQFDTTINKWNTVPHHGHIRTSNPCFGADTPIPTRHGLISIGEWGERGDSRQIWHPEFGWVDAVAARTRDMANTVRLHMSNGMSFSVTPDHRFRTISGEEVIASDALGKNIELSFPSGDIERLGDDWFTVLGFIQGDGHYHLASNRFKYVYFQKADKDVENFMESIDFDIDVDGNQGIIPIEKASDISKWLKSVVLPQRDLTNEIMSLPRHDLAKFLKGLFSANGSVMPKYNRVMLKTSCHNLSVQVQQCLMSLGIRSYITINKQNDVEFYNGVSTCKESYDVNITSTDVVVFSERIGFVQSYKNVKLHDIVTRSSFGRRLHPVVTHVEDNEVAEPVYDFQLIGGYTDSERWACAGGVVAHNCSEVCVPDWSTCNLASVNLIKFFEDLDSPDWEGYEHCCSLLTVALDLVVDISSYPTKMHAKGAWNLRTIGLNHGNIGSVLMRNGIAYDSERGQFVMGLLSSAMTLFAWERSHDISKLLSPYDVYDYKNHAEIMNLHSQAFEDMVAGFREKTQDNPIDKGLSQRWNAIVNAHGFRNNTVTCEVPQGTIGLVLDQDCSGCEPDFALIKHKKCVGGYWMKIVNSTVKPSLERLGYNEESIATILEYIEVWGTVEGAPYIKEEHIGVFDTAVRQPTTLDARKIDLGDLGQSGEALRDILRNSTGPVKAILSELPDDIQDEINKVLVAIQWAKTPDQVDDVFQNIPDDEDKVRFVRRYMNAVRMFSRVISMNGHVDALAAIQPHISMSISKTTNADGDATVDDFKDAYFDAWRKGVKCIAVYRDGSKKSQPLSTTGTVNKKDQGSKIKKEEIVKSDVDSFNHIKAVLSALNKGQSIESLTKTGQDEVKKLVEKMTSEVASKEPWVSKWPATRRQASNYTSDCDQFTFLISDISGIMKVFLRIDRYPGTNHPMHVFIDVGKQGESFSGLVDTMGRLISRAIQHGVPMQEMGDVLDGMTFGPRGMLGKTSVFGIRAASSIPDLIGKVLKSLPEWWEAGRPDSMLHPSPFNPAPAITPLKVAVQEVTHKFEVKKDVSSSEDIKSESDAKKSGYTGKSCKRCGGFRTLGSHTCYQCQDCGEYNGPCGG